jgi:LysM repeat protein
MKNIIRTFFSLLILLVLTACNLGGAANQGVFENPALRLTVQTQNNVTTFNQAGEIINYQYVITNTGTTPLAGPVIVNDAPRQPACPGLNTVGNQDNYLDQNETITCIAAYTVTQNDVTAGSIANAATATAGNTTSNQAGITLTRGTAPPSSVLTLTKTASTQTYGAANESITFTFNITNIGTTPLGPAQFTVTDNKLGAPFNCGPADTTLAPNQSVNCSMPYTVTATDMGQANITNSATASGANQTSAPATVTVANLLAPATATPPTPATSTPGSPSNLTPGGTIQHQVAVGEWLIQIGRCYGATFSELRSANPQIADPDFILPAMTVTVPRIGSAGRIYGPPCVTFHTVQSGDTWASLAQRYNADQAVLQRVNPGGLVAGRQAKIPLNSAGGTGVVVTPIPATAGPTSGATAVPPMRITFDAGSTTATRMGFINPGQTLQYIVAAQQGQTLTVQLTAPPNEVSLGVSGPTGLSLKPADSNYTWTSAVLNTGDHTINMASLTGGSSKSYTLQVSLTTPAPATPTNTPPTPAQ